MDNIIKRNPEEIRSRNAAAVGSRAAAAGRWLADRIPAAVIIALIAMYYIQLSHMGA